MAKKSAMQKVRIGVIGCGGRAFLATDMQAHPLGEVVACCDISLASAQNFAKIMGRHGAQVGLITDDPEQLYSSRDVDAIFICTPDHTHAAIALHCKEAGKHVFCEKPLAINLKDCDKMVRAFEGSKLVFATGLCLRFNVLTLELKRIVSSGEIGDVKLAYGVDSVSPGGQYYFHRWMSRKQYVTSLLLQKGCHSLDIFNWVLDSKPREVFAYGGLDYFGGKESKDLRCSNCDEAKTCPEFLPTVIDTDYSKRLRTEDFCAWSEEIDVGDNAQVLVSYENGAKLSYTECHFTPDYVREFTFVGTKGRVIGWYANPNKTPRESYIEIQMRKSFTRKRSECAFKHGGHNGGDPGVVADFLEAVANGRKPLTDVLAGRECAAISIAAEQSIETGKPVKINNPDGTPRKLKLARKTSFKVPV